MLALSFKHAAADWIGFTPLGRNAPNFWFQKLVAGSSSDQLTALGFPEPGHEVWTTPMLNERIAALVEA